MRKYKTVNMLHLAVKHVSKTLVKSKEEVESTYHKLKMPDTHSHLCSC